MDYEHLLRPRTQKIEQNASFSRRAGAFIVDVLLLDLVITAPIAPLFEGRALLDFTYTHREVAIALVLFLIAFLYFVLFEYVLGQTVGMMLMRISASGRSLWQSLLRNSFLLPIFPFVLFWIIEPAAILLRRRGVLEYLSKTRTLYRKEVLF